MLSVFVCEVGQVCHRFHSFDHRGGGRRFRLRLGLGLANSRSILQCQGFPPTREEKKSTRGSLSLDFDRTDDPCFSEQDMNKYHPQVCMLTLLPLQLHVTNDNLMSGDKIGFPCELFVRACGFPPILVDTAYCCATLSFIHVASLHSYTYCICLSQNPLTITFLVRISKRCVHRSRHR
jgi:hypothetical protein